MMSTTRTHKYMKPNTNKIQKKIPDRKQIIFNSMIMIGAIVFGLTTSVSILLHLGLLQNLSLTNKSIAIFLLAPSITWLAFFLTKFIIRNYSFRFLLPALIISIALAIFTFTSIYAAPIPPRIHSFFLQISDQASSDTEINISEINVQGVVNQNIAFSTVRFSGPAKYYNDQSIILKKGAGISFTRQYTGTLNLLLTLKNCPSSINAGIDGKTFSIDLCKVNTENGLSFVDEATGVIPVKWIVLIRVLFVIDILLFIPLIFGMLYFCEAKFFSFFSQQSIKSVFSENTQTQFIFLSFLFSLFAVLLILKAKIPDLMIFIPGILIILLYQFSIIHPIKKTEVIFFFVILVLTFGIATNLSLQKTQYFNYQNSSLVPLNIKREYSFNSLVNSILNSSNYALYYGFGDILIKHNLYTSEEISSELNIDDDLLAKQLHNEIFVEKEFPYTITDEEYSYLINNSHRRWVTTQNTEIISLERKDYSVSDTIFLLSYKNTLLLLPSSFFPDKGSCQ